MNEIAFGWGEHVFALVFMAGALACALATAMSRSLFAMCMSLAGAHACAAVALVGLGASDAGLALALYGAGFAPVLILAALLLSARAAKAYKRGPTMLAGVAAMSSGVAMLWATPELGVRTPPMAQTYGEIAPWLAVLLFIAAIGCIGLLGYGERGPFERQSQGR